MAAEAFGLGLALLMAQPHQSSDRWPVKMVTVYGAGSWSCAKASEPIYRSQAFAWVMGYFTARNAYSSAQVSGTDGEGIMGEVDLICRNSPSTQLDTAAEQVFRSLKR